MHVSSNIAPTFELCYAVGGRLSLSYVHVNIDQKNLAGDRIKIQLSTTSGPPSPAW